MLHWIDAEQRLAHGVLDGSQTPGGLPVMIELSGIVPLGIGRGRRRAASGQRRTASFGHDQPFAHAADRSRVGRHCA